MSSSASSKDPRRRSRPNVAPQSSAPTSQPQAARVVASTTTASSPTLQEPPIASPTATTPLNINPPPAPVTTQSPSTSNRHGSSTSSTYRQREERHDRENRRGRPSWKSDPSYNNDLAAGGSSSARHSWTEERARGYAREPPMDPRFGRESHHHSDHSATANSGHSQGPPRHERVSRRPSPVRRGRSPVSRGGGSHETGPSLSTPRISDSASISSNHPPRPERGRSPPRASKNKPTSNYSSSRDAAASHSSSAAGGDDIGQATRYRNPFARQAETNVANVGTTSMAGVTPVAAASTSKVVAGSTIAASHSTDSRVPAGSGPTAPIEIEQDHAHSYRQERERGRSKSRQRSKSRVRNKSEDRGRSKSRARSKSQFRSRSRSKPVRRVIAMGEVRKKRPRSPSRSGRRDDNTDSDKGSFIDSESASSDSDANRYRSRSHSRVRRGGSRKKRRYTHYGSSESDESSLNTSDESEGSALDSDMPLALHKSRLDPLPSSHATLNSDPLMRFEGPITEMMTKMNGLMEKCASRMDKLKTTMRKMDVINRRFNAEMRELRNELRIQKMQPTTAFSPQSIPESPQIGQAGASQPSGAPRSRTSSIQSEIVASGGSGGFQSASSAPEPVPPPPSLKPVSGGLGIKTEGNAPRVIDSGVVTTHMPPAPERAVKQAFPIPRSVGYRRVFDRSTYHLPIACQPTMAVLSAGHKTVHGRVFGGRRPNPMEINPFSYQTPFDGIAATSSLDGSIHFWNINTQQLLATVPMKENRVIPYAEVLTWVREDAIVAVSHLKQGASWEPAPEGHQHAEPNSNSLPETQTNLITIYFNREGKLAYRVLTITTAVHSKAINAVTAVMKEDHSMSYITAGRGSEMYHWKFHTPDDQGDRTYDPQGLDVVHQLHSSAITCVAYSYYSKTLFSGGLDKKYISYDLEHDRAIRELRLGPATHILQNPADPRINVVSLLRKSHQYVLMDERVPAQPVLTLGYPATSVISRLSVPSWQPEGGLLCTGAGEDGVVNVWDVRWSGIRLDYNQRPGAGVVTGDVHFDGVVTAGCGASGHPIFRNRPPLYGGPSSRTAGGPSQILNLGGKKIVHACFHPVKNVMMILNKDGSMAFMDYNMRRDPII